MFPWYYFTMRGLVYILYTNYFYFIVIDPNTLKYMSLVLRVLGIGYQQKRTRNIKSNVYFPFCNNIFTILTFLLQFILVNFRINY